MTSTLFNSIVYAWIAIALIIFPLLLMVKAPYGRHIASGWGPMINNKLGWMFMEAPSLLVFGFFFLSGSLTPGFVTWVFFSFWTIHYVNRTFIFPFRLRTAGKKMPLSIVCMGIGFNLVNGFINGYYLGSLTAGYELSWFYDIRFISGSFLFIAGLLINWEADNILIHLRKPGETGYKIPRGGFFRYISCPNHFSEIIEWCGFALMVWSLPALAFALWTAVNLLPRALHHHKWYRKTFPDYPPDRKAIIPFIL